MSRSSKERVNYNLDICMRVREDDRTPSLPSGEGLLLPKTSPGGGVPTPEVRGRNDIEKKKEREELETRRHYRSPRGGGTTIKIRDQGHGPSRNLDRV